MSQSHPADLAITARWIIPVVPPGSVLDDHAVPVRNGRLTRLDYRETTARAGRWTPRVLAAARAIAGQ